MKKLFILAMCFFVTGAIFIAAGAYGIYTYFKKNPIDADPWTVAAQIEDKNWLNEAKVLATISSISAAAGADEWSAKLLTRAGALLNTKQTIAAGDIKPLAQEYLQHAVELGQRVADDTKNYQPLLQARYEYAKLMAQVGEKKRAVAHLRESMDMAKQFSPESRWIREFQKTIDAVNGN